MSNPIAWIHSMQNIAPELRFAASMLADALAEAKAGDASAVAWLEHCSQPWIEWITPSDVSPSVIHQALLATLPTVGAHGINRLAMQLDLFEVEAA